MSPAAGDGSGNGGQPAAGRKAMLLRLDPTVHAALARWAAEDLRSINAQVDWLLRRALTDARRLPPGKAPTRQQAGDSPMAGQAPHHSEHAADDYQPQSAEGNRP